MRSSIPNATHTLSPSTMQQTMTKRQHNVSSKQTNIAKAKKNERKNPIEKEIEEEERSIQVFPIRPMRLVQIALDCRGANEMQQCCRCVTKDAKT